MQMEKALRVPELRAKLAVSLERWVNGDSAVERDETELCLRWASRRAPEKDKL